MKNAARYFLVTLGLMVLVYPTVLADTLELKDGGLLEGTYVGGTRTTLRFQTEDRVKVIPTRQVLGLLNLTRKRAEYTLRDVRDAFENSKAERRQI